MLKNYLKTALRNLWKRKLLTFIHIVGLGVAFGAAMLLFIIAAGQLTFDNFHPNGKDIHLLYFERQRAQGTELSDNMPVPLSPALRREMTGIRRTCRIASGRVASRYGTKELDLNADFADATLLSMFNFPIARGTTGSALAGLNDVVLTQSAATRLFGTADPMNKPMLLNVSGQWKTFVVSAIASDLPRNSSIRFDALMRFENTEGYTQNLDYWTHMNHQVFLQVAPGTRPASIEKRSPSFVNKYFAEDIRSLKRDGGKPGANGQLVSLKLLPLADIHFSKIASLGSPISRVYPWLLIILSIFILFIASTNFINLSLAGSFTRSREIGMRKTLGASSGQIIGQLWGEALITCLLALGLGTLIAKIFMQVMATRFDASVSFSTLLSPQVLSWFTLLFLSVSAFAGGYPALVMSRFNTILTLKGALKLDTKNRLRTVLISIQFVIAILLITCTIVIDQQMNFLRAMPLGYNKTQVISIPIGNEVEPENALRLMRTKLASHPEVISVTGTDINMGRGNDGSSQTSLIGFDYHDRGIKTNWLRVDYDYLKTLDIPLVAGRDFSHDFATDTASVLINEKMAEAIGGKNVIGAVLPLGEGQNLTVVGVVKNFHFRSLHEDISPLTMNIRPDWGLRYIYVKVQPADLPRSMKSVTDTWKEVNPAAKSAPSFLDENTDRLYRSEQMMSVIFTCGASLTIFISCMGLFAIALFIIGQRTKEIGIRKVLGASVPGIVTLLSRDFTRMVLVAFVIAAPLTWFLMNEWLKNFAYRTPLHWWVLPAGGALVMGIATITVGVQAMRAALMKPVTSLKSE